MKLVGVKTSSGILRVWDIEHRVGSNSPNYKLDVKFCQYMFYKVLRGDRRLALSDVIGIWGPKSTAALAAWERGSTRLLRDGIIDVIPPGSDGTGSISHTTYKLVSLQTFYISDMTGIKNLNSAFQATKAAQDVVLRMPIDCRDMPADLRDELTRVRDDDGGTNS